MTPRTSALKRALRTGGVSTGLVKGDASSEAKDGLVPGFSASGQDVWLPRATHFGPGLVLSAVGARCGKVFQADGEWSVVANTVVLSPQPGNDPRFLWYMVNNEEFWEKGGTAQPYVRVPETLSRQVWLPGLSQQRAIADYLDTETARIDALITKKRRLIELLDESIDATVLGHIADSELVRPGGSRSTPIRRLLGRVNRPAEPGSEMITAFRDGQVTKRSARRRDGFMDSWTEGAAVQGVQQGDVVIHGLDGFSGAIGDAEASGVCSPVYHVCLPLEDGDARFYGRLLRLLATTGYLGNFATSTRERAVDFRNWDLFGRIPIPSVPISDQQAIGQLISGLRPLRAAVGASADLAAERRQALITAAVTGELEIPAEAR